MTASNQWYLGVRVREETFGLPLEGVQEILALPRLVRPPHVQHPLEGYLDLGTNLVPVYHLSYLLFGEPTISGLYTPIIVLRSEREPAALLVDQVLDVSKVNPEQVLELPSSETLVHAELRQHQGTVHLLDMPRLEAALLRAAPVAGAWHS